MRHNIELGSAAEYNHGLRFATGQHSQFLAPPKATAPTICYPSPDLADCAAEKQSSSFSAKELCNSIYFHK